MPVLSLVAHRITAGIPYPMSSQHSSV